MPDMQDFKARAEREPVDGILLNNAIAEKYLFQTYQYLGFHTDN